MSNNNFFFKVGDVVCHTIWERPTKSRLLELMIYFNNNFPKAHLFKISLYGGFHSSNHNKTWDIDLKIHFVDLNNKNYKDIYDCFTFLYHHGLNTFNLLVDIKYSDIFFPIQCLTYNLIKNNLYSELKKIDTHSYIGDFIDYTNFRERQINSETTVYRKTIGEYYKKMINVDKNKNLFLIKNKNYTRCFKFIKHIQSGRIYYKDIIINDSCKINNNYFN